MNCTAPITLAPSGRCDLTPVPTVAELQARVAHLESEVVKGDARESRLRTDLVEARETISGFHLIVDANAGEKDGFLRREMELEAKLKAAEAKAKEQGKNACELFDIVKAEQASAQEARSKASALEAKLDAIAKQVASIDMWHGDTIVERIGAILAEVVA